EIHDSRIATTCRRCIRRTRSATSSGFFGQLRIQIWSSDRFGFGFRRSLPPESEFCSAPETLYGCAPERHRLFEFSRDYAQVARTRLQVRRLSVAGICERRKVLRHHINWLHGRAASLRIHSQRYCEASGTATISCQNLAPGLRKKRLVVL